MRIMNIQPESILLNQTEKQNNLLETKKAEGLELTNSFVSFFKNQMIETNDVQNYAEELNKKMVLGEVSNVHDVMIAGQKAGMALEFTMQIRNLVLNAYNQLTQLR